MRTSKENPFNSDLNYQINLNKGPLSLKLNHKNEWEINTPQKPPLAS